MQVNASQMDERRPRPRKRRSDDGAGNTVKEILARNIPSIVMGIVGCFCVFLPIACGMAGLDYWPLVIAYGGCLVGIGISGVIDR